MSEISAARSEEISARAEAAPMSDAISLRDMVCQQVEVERAREGGFDRAYDVVARRIGCMPRRVKAWWYDEVKDPRDSEGQRIRLAYIAWLEREERRHEAEAAAIRQSRIAMQQRLAAIEARL